MIFTESLESMQAFWFVRSVQFFVFYFKTVMVMNCRVWCYWNKLCLFETQINTILGKVFTEWCFFFFIIMLEKSFVFKQEPWTITGTWGLYVMYIQNICAHLITYPETYFFFHVSSYFLIFV